jgi:hypothetical protein
MLVLLQIVLAFVATSALLIALLRMLCLPDFPEGLRL